VSIIPGMETGAPERTLTSSGLAGSPKRRPSVASSRPMCSLISSSSPSGQPSDRYSRQVAVEMAKPGGTGRCRSLAMAAMLAALLPMIFLISDSGRPWSWSNA
jgi:hypothetical protein